ncbi:MAG TPA: hypothetical protein VM778_08525, partial [Gemmatimonadota bacterium]|nr:hypothetical protein [Gemmatimonadota bacterium]
MAEKKRAEVHAMLDRPLEGKQPEEVVVRSGLLEDLTKRLLERALQNAISDSRGLPALIPVPVTTAAASGVEWFQDMSPYCNAVDVETRMPWTPAPASIDGDTYGAACYALAGHTDRARELIGGIPADRRWQAAGTVFDIGHPAADADDELAAGPLMELVVELWPNHYMALYHAGAAAFERGELEKAEDYLTDSSPSTTWKTAGGRAREECWTAFTADLREHPWSVGVGVTSS